ncbi:M50 family metallopeptidase [Arthrobacter sp. 260]|uniref:M50 family metallopeptidase n=1 Tax=Arthrobacter sp. 260 TaxID=2735314 RepID=UPI001492A82B|nr:M50 family metallopeptidase [Arthrobacter sp. 260]NOJ61380.1 M50 family metallopeptidase [Arthrobacter sp. 260]
MIQTWWNRILEGFARAEPPEITALELTIMVLAAAALSIPRPTWRFFGLFTTVVHELGHAFAALMTGRVLKGITLSMDHAGTTTMIGRPGWRAAWSGFWGYPTPAVLGATLTWAGLGGWGPAALSVGALILLAALLFIRNGGGLLILLGAVAISAVLVLALPAAFTGHVVIALGLALMVGAVRDLGKVVSVHLRRRRELQSSDAYLLYRSTGVPSPVWLLLFAVVIAGSLAGAWFPLSDVVGQALS